MANLSEFNDQRVIDIKKAIQEGNPEVINTLSKLLGYSIDQISSDPTMVSYTRFISDRYSQKMFSTNITDPVYQRFLTSND